MADPIPENRNVLGRQQQTPPPVRPAPVRAVPAPVARHLVANPVTPPSWATAVLPQIVPSLWSEVTEPHPILVIETQPPVAAARRGSSGFIRKVRGLLLFAAVLLAAVWGATLAFPSLLQYAIIADIAQLAENIYYTLWGVLYAIGIFALMVYAQRDAIISFVSANPLMSTNVGVGGLLCLILLRLTVKGLRRRQ